MCDVISGIKRIMAIEICLSIGLVRDDQLVKLKAAGVDRINHNLNTPRDNYPKITTTHTYQDRLDTLEVLKRNNINTCLGFICGMGETDEQLIELALDLKSQEPYSVPVNFLLPMPLVDFISIQIIIVYMLYPILGKYHSFLTLFIYLLLGLFGLPVFALGGILYILRLSFGNYHLFKLK